MGAGRKEIQHRSRVVSGDEVSRKLTMKRTFVLTFDRALSQVDRIYPGDFAVATRTTELISRIELLSEGQGSSKDHAKMMQLLLALTETSEPRKSGREVSRCGRMSRPPIYFRIPESHQGLPPTREIGSRFHHKRTTCRNDFCQCQRL